MADHPANKPRKRILSLSEIHRRTGLCLAHISKIYSGKRRPSIDAAKLIAVSQKMTIDEVLDSIKDEANRKKRGKAA